MMRVLRIAVLLAPILLASAAVGLDAAQAQEPEQFVDLSVDIALKDDVTTQGAEVYLWVANRGNRAAHDVNVKFLTGGSLRTRPPVGTANTEPGGVPPNIAPLVGEFKWHIPEMPAHAEYSLLFRFTHSYAATRVWRHYAEATSSSYERPARLQNNEAEAWETWWTTRAGPAEPDYSVRVSAESVSSSSANFTVIAVRPFRGDGESIFEDGCVNIRLTSGITAGSPTFTKLVGRNSLAPVAATDRSFDSSTTRACGDTSGAAGLFLLPVYHTDLESIMTLPVTVDSGATLSEQCLTAEIFATPPTGPGRFYDDPVDNVAKVCPWAPAPPPTLPLQGGEVSAFTLYPCVGITTDPCDSTNDVRVRTTIPDQDGHILDSGTVVFHIQDHPLARAFD